MVEDSSLNSNKSKTKTTRPKAVYLWTEADVQKWLRRHCSDYYNLYWEKFHEHDITGRALVRINDNTLLRMGIMNKEHREAIWREILKLRLKADIVEIRDLERRHNYFNYDLWQKDTCDSDGIEWKDRYPLLKKYYKNYNIYNKRSAVAHLYRALLIILRIANRRIINNRWFNCC